MPELWTIGHSNHPVEYFLDMLTAHHITAVADVRSNPYSIVAAQFNREEIQDALRKRRIYYVYLGEELGPRSPDPACYENKRVVYARLAATPAFAKGIERLKKGMQLHRIALLCSEKDPILCHRMVLICRYLSRDPGLSIHHILEDGSIEEHAASEHRLMDKFRISEYDLFHTREEQVSKAYELQEADIAYSMA